MAESRIKIKASANEINKHFKECPSKYFYIKYYNGEKNYEEIITPLVDLDNQNSYTVARVVDKNRCVELHYREGKAFLEYGKKVAIDKWENEINENVKWFNLKLKEEDILKNLNVEFDKHFNEIEKEIEYDY